LTTGPLRTIIATYSAGTTAKTMEATQISQIEHIREYIIDRLHAHSEANDAQACIALIEEWEDILDEAADLHVVFMPTLTQEDWDLG